MNYKGVEFSITAGAPGVWKWQFRIGERVVAGKTEARLYLLAGQAGAAADRPRTEKSGAGIALPLTGGEVLRVCTAT